MIEKAAAAVRQRHAVGAAFEERRAHGFQLADGAGDGGLGDRQLDRRLRNLASSAAATKYLSWRSVIDMAGVI